MLLADCAYSIDRAQCWRRRKCPVAGQGVIVVSGEEEEKGDEREAHLEGVECRML